jgi:hypothetical protein
MMNDKSDALTKEERWLLDIDVGDVGESSSSHSSGKSKVFPLSSSDCGCIDSGFLDLGTSWR